LGPTGTGLTGFGLTVAGTAGSGAAGRGATGLVGGSSMRRTRALTWVDVSRVG